MASTLAAAPAVARTDGGYVLGVGLSSAGAVAAVTCGFANMAHILDRRPTRTWGWLSIVAGGMSVAGGVVLDRHRGGAVPVAGVLALGVLSVSTGITALLLQSPEAEARVRQRWGFAPVVSSLGSGRRGALLGVQGVY